MEVVREEEGGEETLLARLTEGECFGELAVLCEAPRTATVRAITSIDVLTLHRSAFTTLFAHLPALRDSFQRMREERTRKDRLRKQPFSSWL
ncbi:MAG: cyclic nucleotide-binding domain-containing protein [Nitrospinota bacterium]|nr:MAG: cyclic nucleotide-binding domain-containing protein [Nitrospinota bacterium]